MRHEAPELRSPLAPRSLRQMRAVIIDAHGEARPELFPPKRKLDGWDAEGDRTDTDGDIR